MEEFLELSNWVSWHNSALGACFQLGLDDKTIRCNLPMCNFPLIEMVNLVLYLNGSDFKVEEIKENLKSPHPAPSGTCRVSPERALAPTSSPERALAPTSSPERVAAPTLGPRRASAPLIGPK